MITRANDIKSYRCALCPNQFGARKTMTIPVCPECKGLADKERTREQRRARAARHRAACHQPIAASA